MAVWYSVWKHWKGWRSERRKKVCICDHHWFVQEWEPFWKRAVSTSTRGSITKWLGHQTQNSEVVDWVQVYSEGSPFLTTSWCCSCSSPKFNSSAKLVGLLPIGILSYVHYLSPMDLKNPIQRVFNYLDYYFIYLPLYNGNYHTCIERLVMNENCMIGQVTAEDRMLWLSATCFATGSIFLRYSDKENVLRPIHFTLFHTRECVPFFQRY